MHLFAVIFPNLLLIQCFCFLACILLYCINQGQGIALQMCTLVLSPGVGNKYGGYEIEINYCDCKAVQTG